MRALYEREGGGNQIKWIKHTNLKWKSDLDASGLFLTGRLTFIGSSHEGFG